MKYDPYAWEPRDGSPEDAAPRPQYDPFSQLDYFKWNADLYGPGGPGSGPGEHGAALDAPCSEEGYSASGFDLGVLGDPYGIGDHDDLPRKPETRRPRPVRDDSPSRPLRVIVVLPRLLRGGAEQWLLYLAKFLDPKRIKLLRCIVTNPAASDPLFVAELPIRAEAQRADSMQRAVRDCDVLIVFGVATDDLLGDLRAKLCVYVAHGEGGWTQGLLDRSRQTTDHVIAVSKRVKLTVCEGFPTTVIYNGIDAARVAQSRSRGEVRRRHGFQDSDFVLGYLGRFSQEKQLDLLIRAVEKLPPRFKLFLVGWGHLRQRLLDHANDLIPCRYAFTTACTYLGDYYHAMDAFALVSNQEGFSLALLEAMMCGLPIIGTPVGSVPEMIVDRVNGVVVKPQPDSIAQGVSRLADNPAWARSVAAEGARFAEEHGHARRMARDYEDLLAKLWKKKVESRP